MALIFSSWVEADKGGPRFCQKVYSDYFITSDSLEVCKNHLHYESV
jgi:hypothetical protein